MSDSASRCYYGVRLRVSAAAETAASTSRTHTSIAAEVMLVVAAV